MARHDARALAEAEARLPPMQKKEREGRDRNALIVAGRGVLDRLSRLKVILLQGCKSICFCAGVRERDLIVWLVAGLHIGV